MKYRKEATEADGNILASEAPYLRIAKRFGLRVGADLTYRTDALMIPRFDRTVIDGGTVRHGQESLLAAAGRLRAGDRDEHENYLKVIARTCADPAADIIEWVRRDVLNLAMGNPDNHGRNFALHKPHGNDEIRLAPLFDFAPMSMDPRMIPRVTRWRCLDRDDAVPDWNIICAAAAAGRFPPERLKAQLKQDAAFIVRLPDIAAEEGVPKAVIDRALRWHQDIAGGLAKLEP